jgi:DNA topoisomerase-1
MRQNPPAKERGRAEMVSTRHRCGAPGTFAPAGCCLAGADMAERQVLDETLPIEAEGRAAAAVAAATQAKLTYVSDSEPGIRRKAAGARFSYFYPDGGKVTDRSTLQRIHEIVIPPAWTDVWICPDADGHIQATGRDQRGRKQYRYHPRWLECRDEAKYSSLAAFARALPAMRAAVEADLRKRSLSWERVVASIIWLLDNTMIRVGNAQYARDNESFGLTTLRGRHVEVEGAKLRFRFKGKSGKQWQLKLVDRRMAKIIRSIQDLPGQQLFQYVDEAGEARLVRSQDVNEYIRDASGGDFSSKDFRTWGGTVRAAAIFAQTPLPETKTGVSRVLNAAIDQVAHQLGNTRSVCRSCYIHPGIIDSWQNGELPDELAALARSRRKTPRGLDEEEALVLFWLELRESVNAAG